MTNSERALIRDICDGDMKNAKTRTKLILKELNTKKDEAFREAMLRKLETKSNFVELPTNLRELLIAEDVSDFPERRFILRQDEEAIVKSILAAEKASARLSDMGILYQPSLMLYGQSGGGKTMLARYIAYLTDRPFVWVRFSGLVSSYLGSTQSNLAKVFDYARSVPCVLCFDEIDAVGMLRGQKNDIGEMNRIVITLIQELDRLPNNVILIGTTNRYDRLDPALTRRFTLNHEILPMRAEDVRQLAGKFFHYAGIDADEWLSNWCASTFAGVHISASAVVEQCTKLVVDKIIAEDLEK
jgi:SpoVK/Ycf46/Vps4 family AAA+-type ATPase